MSDSRFSLCWLAIKFIIDTLMFRVKGVLMYGLVYKLALSLSLLWCTISSASDLNLRILAWEGYVSGFVANQFSVYIKKKYDIDVSISYSYVAEPQDFYNSLRLGQTDIISPTHNVAKSLKWNLIENSLVSPIDLRNIPNYFTIPEFLRRREDLGDGGNIYGVPFLYGTYALAYNTRYISDEPDSWNVLWRYEHRNKYSVVKDFYDMNIYITALASGIDPEHLDDIDRIYSETFLKKLNYLARNANNMWVGVDKFENLNGMHIATTWGFSLKDLSASDDNWKIATPKEGSMGWIDCWMISASVNGDPVLKLIAEEWINFTLLPEIQEHYSIYLSSLPVNQNVFEKLSNDGRLIHKYSRFIPFLRLDRRTQNAFKYYWQKALK